MTINMRKRIAMGMKTEASEPIVEERKEAKMKPKALAKVEMREKLNSTKKGFK